MAITKAPGYGKWRGTADRLLQEGEAILTDRICGPHLDRVSSVRRLADERVSSLGDAIGEDDQELAEAEREARERHRLSNELARLRFAADADAAAQPDPAPADDDGTRADQLLWRLRQVYDWDGRLAKSERQASIEAETQASLERWQALRAKWNRQVDRAEKEGVHVIYTSGYGDAAPGDGIHRPRRSVHARRGPLGDRPRDPRARRGGGRAQPCRAVPRCRRGPAEAAPRDPGLRVVLGQAGLHGPRGYGAWRRDTERAVEAAERLLADRERYGVHLDGLAYHPAKSLRSAAAGAREVLADDDRQMAEVLVPERKGDDPRRREERIAALLDDPEKLRELHRRQIERREQRKAARRRRKGRYRVRSMRM